MHVFRSLPKNVYVAVSGGVDSMVLLHFLQQKNHNVFATHYVHGNEYSDKEFEFVYNACEDMGITLSINIDPALQRDLKKSQEEQWRDDRYAYFKEIDGTVCTGHTLDDMVEWYLFTSLHGEGRYMEYRHANIVRPFICTKKIDILEYAYKHKILHLEDPSNADVEFAARNRIRHEIMPAALKVNPGLYKTVQKKFEQKFLRDEKLGPQ